MVERKHSTGIGHHQPYYTMQSGHPNYKKAVKNARRRAEEIATMTSSGVTLQNRAEAPDHKSLQVQELAGIQPPPEWEVVRVDDGYVVHCGMMKVSLEKLKALIRVMRDPSIV
jgi:hypothetical protein